MDCVAQTPSGTNPAFVPRGAKAQPKGGRATGGPTVDVGGARVSGSGPTSGQPFTMM